MKTAEEWAINIQNDMASHAPDGHVAMTTEFRLYRNHIKAIQLDAMREGMRFAAEIADAAQNRYNTVKDAKTSILEAAEKLTEKDL